MLPIVLDPRHVRAALVGAGPLAARRLALLSAAGVIPAVHRIDATDTALPEACADAEPAIPVIDRLPSDDELAGINLLLIAGVPDDLAAPLAERARARGVLTNVEDVIPLCDFHMPGIVRRGDLLLSVSTAGKGPGVARLIRRRLEALFPEAWAERLALLGAKRAEMRADGASPADINRAVTRIVEENQWLP